jgi:hypothetical protein
MRRRAVVPRPDDIGGPPVTPEDYAEDLTTGQWARPPHPR